MSLRGSRIVTPDGNKKVVRTTVEHQRDVITGSGMKDIHVGGCTTTEPCVPSSGLIDDAQDVSRRLLDIRGQLASSIADLTGTSASAGPEQPERADRTVQSAIQEARLTLNIIESQLIHLNWILNGDKALDSAVRKAIR